jgi:predicted O-methyltransferase YrrM
MRRHDSARASRSPLRRAVSALAGRLGYEIRAVDPVARRATDHAPALASARFTHLDHLVERASFIPGMLSPESGKLLYALCYMQRAGGCVVEIGSWQGYSTSYLAQATVDSGNGPFYAIDHFRGNAGKEDRYVVGTADLSDLRANFEANMRRLGLWEGMTLLDMPSAEAASRLSREHIRFLFIDGDHTRAGVERDIALFFPLLADGAMVVFDDFAPAFPGVVGAVDALLRRRRPERVFAYRNSLVISL